MQYFSKSNWVQITCDEQNIPVFLSKLHLTPCMITALPHFCLTVALFSLCLWSRWLVLLVSLWEGTEHALPSDSASLPHSSVLCITQMCPHEGRPALTRAARHSDVVASPPPEWQNIRSLSNSLVIRVIFYLQLPDSCVSLSIDKQEKLKQGDRGGWCGFLW